jgi:hypothetical protein
MSAHPMNTDHRYTQGSKLSFVESITLPVSFDPPLYTCSLISLTLLTDTTETAQELNEEDDNEGEIDLISMSAQCLRLDA